MTEKAKEKVVEEEKKADGKAKYAKYARFADLKFLMWNGNSHSFDEKLLKESYLKEYKELEAEVKKFTGSKPKKSATIFLAGHAKNIKLVEGYAIPAELELELESDPKAINILKKYF